MSSNKHSKRARRRTGGGESVEARRYRRLRERLGPNHPQVRAAHAKRRRHVLAAEQKADKTGWWWLSFVDAELAKTIPLEEQVPGGPSFLGCILTHADGFLHAVDRVNELGINPGGEVKGWLFGGVKLPDDYQAEWCDRLLDAAATKAMPDPLDAAGARGVTSPGADADGVLCDNEPEQRHTRSADVEHEVLGVVGHPCPYRSVLVDDDGAWFCTKCGNGGHLDDTETV